MGRICIPNRCRSLGKVEGEFVQSEGCCSSSLCKANVSDVQLHTFADASNVARGAVCYLRYVDRDGRVHCSLVMAKSLLAGSEKHTISRLELEAALDAVQLAKFVRTELELHSCPCIYWTDSTIVLQSLRAESKKFPFFRGIV